MQGQRDSMTQSGEVAGVAPSSPVDRRPRWVLLAPVFLLAIVLGYWAVAVNTPFPVGFWSDDATYVSTARSLARGTGYRHIQTPGEPLQTRYPPLYPALLSLGFRFGQDYPANWPLLLMPGAVAASALWWLSVAYWRRIFDAPSRLLLSAAGLALVSPVVLAFVRYTMSDLLYGALSIGALLCLDTQRGHSARRDAALLLAGGLLVALSILTRSIGITLLFGALFGLALQRRWANAGVLLGLVLACCGPWWAWQMQAAAENGDLQTALMTAADLSYGLWWPENVSQIAEVLRQNSLRIAFSVANYQLALPRAGLEAALASPSWRTVLLFCVAGAAVGVFLPCFRTS